MRRQWLVRAASVCMSLLMTATLVPTTQVLAAEEKENEVLYSTGFSDSNGLCHMGNNVWYYKVNGVTQWNYTGLVEYYGTWYYVKNGVLDWSYTGLTQYYGTGYYVEKGVLNWNYSGDLYINSKKYTIRGGVVEKTQTAMTRSDVVRRMAAAGRSSWFAKYNRCYVEDKYNFAYINDDMGWTIIVDRYTGKVTEFNLFQRIMDSFTI